MKLSGRDIPGFFARPDPGIPGLLIHGADAMRVALRRQQAIAALIGPEGPGEMRLTAIAPAELRKAPAALADAAKARGFFPGTRVVHLEGATDAAADAAALALGEWRPDDARIVVTAGALTARSKLRRLFEGHPRAVAAAIYDDPPGPDEVARILAGAGLADLPQTAMADLTALAGALDPGDFAQLAEKLAIYKLDDPEPVSPADIEAVAPPVTEAAVERLIDAVADGRTGEIGGLIRRLEAQGVQPVAICIAAQRLFRTLHAAAAHPDGPDAGVAALRPPLYGPRRRRAADQARRWGARRLGEAMGALVEIDLALRSAAPPPQMAATERVLIRLAHKAGR